MTFNSTFTEEVTLELRRKTHYIILWTERKCSFSLSRKITTPLFQSFGLIHIETLLFFSYKSKMTHGKSHIEKNEWAR